VGGQKSLNVDVRVIAATNTDLEESVKEGGFREDLFYRLNVFRITVPPLRERLDDISIIAFGFLAEVEQKYSMTKSLSEEALEVLESHSWPGNVRELRNIIERAAIMSKGDMIMADDIPSEIFRDTADYSYEEVELAGMPMKDIEKQAIIQTLEKCKGNKKKTAEMLGIGLKTLYRKLAQYGREK
jgi:DNA-binding NtrC family response regulator